MQIIYQPVSYIRKKPGHDFPVIRMHVINCLQRGLTIPFFIKIFIPDLKFGIFKPDKVFFQVPDHRNRVRNRESHPQLLIHLLKLFLYTNKICYIPASCQQPMMHIIRHHIFIHDRNVSPAIRSLVHFLHLIRISFFNNFKIDIPVMLASFLSIYLYISFTDNFFSGISTL